MNLPSVKTLSGLTGGDIPKARELRSILEGSCIDPDRAGFYFNPLTDSARRNYPHTSAWLNSCYAPVSPHLINLHIADELLGTCGVESIQPINSHRFPVTLRYCNTGDAYAATLALQITRKWWGREFHFLVISWGDYVETKERRGWKF